MCNEIHIFFNSETVICVSISLPERKCVDLLILKFV